MASKYIKVLTVSAVSNGGFICCLLEGFEEFSDFFDGCGHQPSVFNLSYDKFQVNAPDRYCSIQLFSDLLATGFINNASCMHDALFFCFMMVNPLSLT